MECAFWQDNRSLWPLVQLSEMPMKNLNSIAGYFKEQRCAGTRFEHLLSGTIKSTNRLNYLPLWDAWPFYQRNLTQAFQWFIERRYLKLTLFRYSMIIFPLEGAKLYFPWIETPALPRDSFCLWLKLSPVVLNKIFKL